MARNITKRTIRGSLILSSDILVAWSLMKTLVSDMFMKGWITKREEGWDIWSVCRIIPRIFLGRSWHYISCSTSKMLRKKRFRKTLLLQLDCQTAWGLKYGAESTKALSIKRSCNKIRFIFCRLALIVTEKSKATNSPGRLLLWSQLQKRRSERECLGSVENYCSIRDMHLCEELTTWFCFSIIGSSSISNSVYQ